MKPLSSTARGPAEAHYDPRSRFSKHNRLQKQSRKFLGLRRAVEAELREEAEEVETRLGVRLNCLHNPRALPRPPVDK